MLSFKKIMHSFFDIFFPRSVNIKKFENMTTEELLNTIPQAEIFDNEVIFPILSYKHELTRAMIWELKYRKNKIALKLLSKIMYDFMLAELSDIKLFSNFSKPLLIPIPLSSKKYRERGFNQIELIAEEIQKLANQGEFEYRKDILKKKRNTISQSKTKNRTERLKNLKDCFEVPFAARDYARGRNIILIDDVTTTGTTIREARRALKSAGARKIIAFTIAH